MSAIPNNSTSSKAYSKKNSRDSNGEAATSKLANEKGRSSKGVMDVSKPIEKGSSLPKSNLKKGSSKNQVVHATNEASGNKRSKNNFSDFDETHASRKSLKKNKKREELADLDDENVNDTNGTRRRTRRSQRKQIKDNSTEETKEISDTNLISDSNAPENDAPLKGRESSTPPAASVIETQPAAAPVLPRRVQRKIKKCEKCRLDHGAGKSQCWIRLRPAPRYDDNIFEVGLDQKTLKLLADPERHTAIQVTKHRRDKSFKQKKKYIYATDGILQSSSQDETYSKIVAEVVEQAVKGVNGAIICLGPEISGKSFSLFGHLAKFEYRGIIPRALEQLFFIINEKCLEVDYCVRMGVIEIRRDRIRDLLTLGPYELPIVSGNGPNGMLLQQIGCAEHGLGLLIRALTVQQNIPRETFARYHTVVYIDLYGETLTLQEQPRIIKSRMTFVKIASIPDRAGNDMRGEEFDPFEGFLEVDGCVHARPATTATATKTNEEWKPPRKVDTCCLYQAGPLGEAICVRRELSFLAQMLTQANERRDLTYCNPWLKRPIRAATAVPSQYFRQSKLSHCLQDIVAIDSEVRVILHIRPENQFLQATFEAIRFLERAKCIPKDWRIKNQYYSCGFGENPQLRDLFVSEGARPLIFQPELINSLVGDEFGLGLTHFGLDAEDRESHGEFEEEEEEEEEEELEIPTELPSTVRVSASRKGKRPKTAKSKRRKDKKKRDREKSVKSEAESELNQDEVPGVDNFPQPNDENEEEEQNIAAEQERETSPIVMTVAESDGLTNQIQNDLGFAPATKGEAWHAFLKSEDGIAMFEELSNIDNSYVEANNNQAEVLQNLSILLSKINLFQAELNFVQQERHLRAEEFGQMNSAIVTNQEKEIQCHLQFLQLSHDEQIRHLKSIRIQLHMQKRIIDSRKDECEAALEAFCWERWAITFPKDSMELPTMMDPMTNQIVENEEEIAKKFQDVKLLAKQQARELLHNFFPRRPAWNPY